MRVCRFNNHRAGVVEGDKVRDVTAIVEGFARDRMDNAGDPLIRLLPQLRRVPAIDLAACEALPLADLRLLSPIARPSKILAAPDNYRDHAAEMQADASAGFGHKVRPLAEAGLFLKAVSSLVGPSEGIPLCFLDRRTDYEIELVIIIGEPGRNIAATEAMRHVAAYAVGLDVTIRGSEDRSFRKSLDGYTVVGPWLTTVDEVRDPQALTLTLHQNGTLRQNSTTAQLITGIAQLIAYASAFCALHPGDMIFTGTPSGVGPIRPGDSLKAEIAGVGAMTVAVRAA